MPYQFQHNYFFLSKTNNNICILHLMHIALALVGPPLLIPIYFHVEVVYYVFRHLKWVVRICSNNNVCQLINITGSTVGHILLLPSALDVCANNGRILAQLCILFLYQVSKDQYLHYLMLWQVFREPLVCVGHSIKPHSNGGQLRPEWRMGRDAGT